MKRKTKLILIGTAIIVLAIIYYKYSHTGSPAESAAYSGSLAIPTLNNSDQVITHTAYTLQYNETNEQPDWVAYYLTQNRLNGSAARMDDFREDPLVSTGSAQPDDYKHSGYDRGHMAPAGDFTWSQTAMSESFYLSNMSPQLHSFNAGIWEILENQIRNWANIPNDTLFIAAGPILKNGLPVIGSRGRLTVPEYFYKAILRKSPDGFSAIAFIMKHENSTKPLSYFAVTVDSLEKRTGIDFFSKLPVQIQAEAELKFDADKWPGISLSRDQLKKRLSKH